MATISSSLASSLLPLLCLLLTAAAKAAAGAANSGVATRHAGRLPRQVRQRQHPLPFRHQGRMFPPRLLRRLQPHLQSPPPLHRHRLSDMVAKDLYYLISENGTLEETKPTWSAWPIELADVSLSEGKARVLGAFSYECRLNKTHSSVRRQRINFNSWPWRPSPFVLSADDNVLMGIGSGIVATQTTGQSCEAYTSVGPVNGSCFGQGCCQATLLPLNTNSKVTIQKEARYFHYSGGSCSYAMIVEKTWYNFSTVDLDNDAFLRRNAAGVVPVVVDFTKGIGEGGCPKASDPTPKDFACVSNNSECVDRQFSGIYWTYYGRCSAGYEGNPYILGGCQDIDECARPDMYPCHWKCKNTPGHYECSCPAGTRGNATEGPCTDLFPLPAKISVGMVGGLFIIALLVFTILIRNEKRKTTEFFKKNGGPTLEKAKIIKIYKKGELNPILKPSNFIGRGAFGEVYKGFLDDQLVSVKKPIGGNADVAQNDQFANEVIIQSQVVHKNIVRLLGCWLEVDKPMLVYEFRSKGSLDDILHGSSCAPITLECRLNIAAESAEGLAYLHSKTTNTILHGDVKPANILLNDSFTPKICDFGISRLIVIDKEHTDFVIGDRTYMDPVSLRDGLLTDKSDVYSFGVVLLELISRKKATYSDNNSLVRNFLDAHKSQKKPIELFDMEIAKPEVLNLLYSLYEIAVNCLNLDVDKRPNMIEVAESLLMLKRSWSNTLTSHVAID